MWRRLKRFLFHNDSTQQTVLKNTFWLTVSQLAARSIRAGIVIYAARILGAVEYGTFSYALSIAALATICIDFGINALITRESTRDLSQQRRYFATAFVIKTVALAVVAIAMLVVLPLLPGTIALGTLLPLLVLIVIFDSMRDFGAALSRAWERMEIEAGVQIATNVLIALGGIGALVLAPRSSSILAAYAVGTGIGMIIALYPYRSYLRTLVADFDATRIRSILVASWPFGLVGVMGGILLNTDSIMLGLLGSAADVGYYAAGQRIVQLLYFIPYPLASALFPFFARTVGEPKALREGLEYGIATLMLIAVPLSVVGISTAGIVFNLLYGHTYDAGIGAFVVMHATYVPVFLASMLGNTLFALRRERTLVTYVVLAITGNALCNLALIPFLGPIGAALATLINQTIMACYLIVVLVRTTGAHPFGKTRHIAVASIALVITTLVIGYAAGSLLLGSIVGLIAYGGVLIYRNDPIVNKIRSTFLPTPNA